MSRGLEMLKNKTVNSSTISMKYTYGH